MQKQFFVLIHLLSILCPLIAWGQQTNQTVPQAPARLKEQELIRQLEKEVTQRCGEDRFSGVLLLAKNNKPLLQKACGYANREQKILNTTETRLNLGSMNKMFTSIAIAQLVNQGKLNYSDTIVKLLPDYPNRKAAEKVTVEHLLTHASGLGDFFTPEFMQDRKKIHSLKDYLPYFANRELQFEPGTKRSYSNAGFIVAGLIIEKFSGKNYFDYVKENIYKTADMRNSFGFEDRVTRPSMAVGYTRERGPMESNEFVLVAGSPAGGGYSTVFDLLKFADALRTQKLVPQQLLHKVIGMDRPSGSTYGYGFSREEVRTDLVIGHNGGAEGINADMDIYWKSGYVVIALANMDPRAAEEITHWVKERIQP